MLKLVVSVDFLKSRLLATETFQASVAAIWVWAKRTVAEWGDHRTSLEDTEGVLLGLERDLRLERPGTDADLDALHLLTVQAIGMARSFYLDNPVILQSLQDLTASADGRQGKLDEARDLEIAWEKLPEADRDKICTVTLAQFKTKRASTAPRVEALIKLESDEHDARIKLHHLVAKLWKDCVAWYQAALLVFPQETPDGQKLRDNIPTEDTGSTAPSVETTKPEIPGDTPPGGTPSG